MITFPEPPERVLDYIFTAAGKSWKWNGEAWLVHTTGGSGNGQVSPHKSTHATGGSDELTPSDIGAASDSHKHDELYSLDETKHIELKNNGDLTLPHGGKISDSATAEGSLTLTPPNAGAGQGLVVRPTVSTWSITSSGNIVYGSPITISVGQLSNGNYFGTVNYSITGTGVTQASLGRALTGSVVFSGTGPETETITWTIPANSDITEFTLTLTSVDGTRSTNISTENDPALYYNFEYNGMPTGQFVTVTNDGISNSEHSHVHLISADPSTVDIYLGDDDQYVKIERNAGGVVVGNNNNTNKWNFKTDGDLEIPAAGDITKNGTPAYATAAQGTKADSASQPGHTHPLTDLEQGTATNGQVMTWNSTSSTWTPQTPATGGSSVSVASNSGVTLTSNTLATAYNTTIGDSVVSVSVGGAPATAASTWKTKTIVQVLDDILFPTILASVGSAKSTTLSVSGTSGTLEVGTLISRTLTATFSRGTITNGSGSTNSNPLVGAATGYTFTGTGISSTSQTGNTLTFNSSVVSGTNQWTVVVAHDAGTGTYTDNKGVTGTNLNASRVSGTSTDSTTAITGVYPYYYYKSANPISSAAMVTAIQNGTATKVVGDSTGTLSIPYNLTSQYLAVAYPTTSTLKTRYFVTVSDADAITVVFQTVATPSVITSLWTQTYNVHVSKSALTNTNAIIELRNS